LEYKEQKVRKEGKHEISTCFKKKLAIIGAARRRQEYELVEEEMNLEH
jgi:hypothetical protein